MKWPKIRFIFVLAGGAMIAFVFQFLIFGGQHTNAITVSGTGLDDSSRFPVLFEQNQGQAPSNVDFLVRNREGIALLSSTTLSLPSFRQCLVGGDTDSRAVLGEATPSVSHYFLGSDPDAWHTDIKNFRSVMYSGVYPETDMIYDGTDGRLTYRFVVHPGGDPSQIAFALEGADSVIVTPDRVMAETPQGMLSWGGLRAYQMIEGREIAVEAAFIKKGENGYGFRIGDFDPAQVLIIDPTLELEQSTYIGGSLSESGPGIALDASDNIFLVGSTSSADFPLEGIPYQGANAGGQDVVVLKLNAEGTEILWSTYLGGALTDSAAGVAVDGNGEVYVFGATSSVNFPTLNPFQGAKSGGQDLFLAKFSSDGSSLVYSTYLGGTADDFAIDLVLDDTSPIVIGHTTSVNFPTANAIQAANAGGYDIVVTKFDPAGNALTWSTYFGGTTTDFVNNVRLDASGDVYFVGQTLSANYPTTAGAYQTVYGGGTRDVSLTKFDADGTTVLYSTYVGGNANDSGRGIAVDADGAAYIVGNTDSANYPLLNPVQGAMASARDGFVTKLTPSGDALLYSTYLGGNGNDLFQAVVVDSGGSAYVGGVTSSVDFPILIPIQDAYGGGSYDNVVFELDPQGDALIYSTYLGGNGSDGAVSLALTSHKELIVSGLTASADFPLVNALDTTLGGTQDLFLSRLSYEGVGGSEDFIAPQIQLEISADPPVLSGGPGSVTYTYLVTNPGFPPLNDVTVSDSQCGLLTFVSGDFNGDGKLQSYDAWTYSCTVALDQTTTHVATAVGYANTQQASDTATVTVEVEEQPAFLELFVRGLRAYLNLQTGCRTFVEEALLLNPVTGLYEHPGDVCPGDLITAPSFRSLYYVTHEFFRRPFLNALTFLTHYPNFAGVHVLTDATLLTLELGQTIPPRAGTVLVRFEGDPGRVYALFENPQDPFMPLARVFETEEIAATIIGPDWEDYVLYLPPTMSHLFLYGAPIRWGQSVDSSKFLKRQDLEAVMSPYTFSTMK